MTNIRPIRVTIFDDNLLILDSVSDLIRDSEGLELTGAFPNCNHLIRDLENSRPDVVVMDIEMPGVNGIEAAKIIRKSHPEITVMMQTSYEDDDKVFDAICAGASGYMLKNTPPEKIISAIREVHEGGSPMSPSIARKVLGFLQRAENVPSTTNADNYKLTPREKDVLSCLVKGMSYKMIADKCEIGYETVRTHMKKIYDKLHVASMTEAVAKAINQNLV